MIANSSPPPVDRLAVLLTGTLITLMVVGYPMAGLIATGLGLESTATSIPLRLLTLAISAATVLHIATAGRRVRMDAAVILFWWLYLLRLIVDARSGQFQDVGDALIFFLAAIVVPAAAVMIGAVGYNERFIAWRLFIVGTTVCAASMLLDALGVGDAASLTEVTGRLSFEALNPISLGHVATTTVLAALVLWRKSQTPVLRAGLSIGMAVAVVCLLLAASRGPVLALMVALISFSIFRGRVGQIFAGGLAVLIVAPILLASQGVELVERFTNIASDMSGRERLMIQLNAIDQAIRSPVLGSAYTELQTGQYPHNLLLESFMALGVVGGALFLFICLRTGFRAAVRLRLGEMLLPLLFVQYFVGAQFSSSLWGAEAFWAVVVLIGATAPPARRALRARNTRLRGDGHYISARETLHEKV